MTGVGVFAHSAKTLGGGLEELRKTLATNGISDPMWCEVPKSRFVPEQSGTRRSRLADSRASSSVCRWPPTSRSASRRIPL